MATVEGKTTSRYLQKLFRELTKDVELPGPGEYIPKKDFVIPDEVIRLGEKTGRVVHAFREQYKEVKDKDYRDQINPEALQPNENTKWMNQFK